MTDRINRLEDAFRAFGYVVIAEPVLDSEELFADTLSEALSKVERTFAYNAKRYHFRGRSKRALDVLHADLPYPCFGVEVMK